MIMNKMWNVIMGVLLPLVLLGQAENWIYRYNGSANFDDIANSIIYGADGNIYVAGLSYDSVTRADLTVVSLTTAGDTNWVYRYNGARNDSDCAYSIVYGADDNIYAAGVSDSTDTNADFTVISLTTAGVANWVYRYNGPGDAGDYAYSITYGADGNIYAAGRSSGIWPERYFTVISLTTAGDTNWVYQYNGPAGNGWDEANSIIYGADGNIYAAGSSYGIGTSEDFTVISLTTAGDTNWVYQYNGPLNVRDRAYSIVYGADDNIYAAGFNDCSFDSADFMVISLTTAGDTNWIYRYDGPANYLDVASSLVYGGDGNIYVGGYSHGSGTYHDFIVISLTTAGDTNWIYRYDGPGHAGDYANSLVYGADDNIYAAGWSYGSGTYYDFIVISLTTAGDTNWIYRYNGPGNESDVANSLVYGADGNIYAAGSSYGSGTRADLTVVSLPPDMGMEEKNTIIRENSFGATILKGTLMLPEGKQCRVFDITGRVVVPQHIKPGIYFIEIDGLITQKVVKIR